MSKLKDWFNRTPTVDVPTKEELNKARSRCAYLVGGGSHVERPHRPSSQIPPDWNKEIKEENPALDLIHGYKAELDNPYISSIFVKDVLWMLDEIEKTLKEV